MPRQRKTPACTNCSYKFIHADNYCPVCGQKNHELRIPLRHLLGEVLDTTLHIDSKTFRTIRLLLQKPGFLSREFNSGKRADYVPPIRLYVLDRPGPSPLISIAAGLYAVHAQTSDATDVACNDRKGGNYRHHLYILIGGVADPDGARQRGVHLTLG